MRQLTPAFVALASLAFYMSLAPFAGDPCYHDFADARPFLGIPNFFDVVSNLPFLIVGIAGFRVWRRQRPAEAPQSWLAFIVGVTGVAFGSAYYHWDPSDATLVWDRLPMALGFMGLTVAMMAEMIRPAFDRRLLLPALLLGCASVFNWYFRQDLRPYLWVQTLPLLIVPTTSVVFAKRYSHQSYLLSAIAFYVAAKLAEKHDRTLFTLLGQSVSGHTIKHLLAASACGLIVIMLHKRKPIPT